MSANDVKLSDAPKSSKYQGFDGTGGDKIQLLWWNYRFTVPN